MNDKEPQIKLSIVEGNEGYIPKALAVEAISFNTADQFTKGTFLRALKRKDSWFIVLNDSQEVVASFMLLKRKTSKKLRLYSIAVDNQYKGHGIGSYIMSWIIDYATNKGFCELTLEVRENNETATKLYRKFGFSEVKTLQAYYSDGVNGIKMSKQLG